MPVRRIRFTLVALLCGTASAAAQGIAWQQDFNAAYQQAAAANKLLLVNVHTSWCGPCRAMQATTFLDASVVRTIGEHCVALDVDGDSAQSLMQRLGVTSFPTQVFVSPAGNIVGRIVGYRDAATENQSIQQLAGSARTGPQYARQAPPAPAPRRSAPQTAGVAKPMVRPTRTVRDEPLLRPCDASMPLALEGFSLVSMIGDGKKVRGDKAFCVGYRGKRYQFRSAAELAQFRGDPEKYLPGADGHCPVTLAEDGREVPGNVQWPCLFEDSVYFFASQIHRDKFLDDPVRYVAGL